MFCFSFRYLKCLLPISDRWFLPYRCHVCISSCQRDTRLFSCGALSLLAWLIWGLCWWYPRIVMGVCVWWQQSFHGHCRNVCPCCFGSVSAAITGVWLYWWSAQHCDTGPRQTTSLPRGEDLSRCDPALLSIWNYLWLDFFFPPRDWNTIRRPSHLGRLPCFTHLAPASVWLIHGSSHQLGGRSPLCSQRQEYKRWQSELLLSFSSPSNPKQMRSPPFYLPLTSRRPKDRWCWCCVFSPPAVRKGWKVKVAFFLSTATHSWTNILPWLPVFTSLPWTPVLWVPFLDFPNDKLAVLYLPTVLLALALCFLL